MLPIPFPGANAAFGKPDDWEEGSCLTLPARVGKLVGSELNATLACFELSPEELAEVNKTGKVYLTIIGGGWPPVIMSTEPTDIKE